MYCLILAKNDNVLLLQAKIKNTNYIKVFVTSCWTKVAHVFYLDILLPLKQYRNVKSQIMDEKQTIILVFVRLDASLNVSHVFLLHRLKNKFYARLYDIKKIFISRIIFDIFYEYKLFWWETEINWSHWNQWFS